MCGGRRPPTPPQMAPAPPIKPPAPERDVPKPEEISDAEKPNIITGKKRSKLEAEIVERGTEVFEAIQPGTNPDTPTQGVPNPNP
jgi:hypothetical protein